MTTINSIEDVGNSVTLRSKLLRTIVTVSQEYFSALSKFILGMNPREHEILTSAFAQAKDILDRLGSVSDVSLRTLYNIYEDFDAIESAVNNFILLCNSKVYARASLAEMSTGHHANMRADISRALTSYDKYLAASRDDDEIFTFAIKITRTKHDEYYKFLFENHAPNKLTMELIRQLLPIVTGDKLIFISELINEQKNEIFGSGRVKSIVGAASTVSTDRTDSTVGKVLNGHECVIYRYGLAPFTISMPMRDLFKTLDWKWDDSKSLDDNMDNAAGTGNNIVLIWRPAKSPIEFDFRGVLDVNYVRTMTIKPYSGLNKNYVARYNTTSVLSTGVSATAVSTAVSTSTQNTNTATNTTPNVHPADTRPEARPAITLYSATIDVRAPIGFVVSRLDWTVIETINGIDYRAIKNQSVVTDTDYDHRVSGKLILGLLTGVSTLPTEYNLAHAQNILRTHGDMFDPAARANIDRYTNYEKSVPSSDPIKNNVVGKLELYVRSHVDSIMSNRDWQSLFVSDGFTAAVNTAIADVLVEGSLIDKIKSPEYTITFVARVNTIITKFMKSITRAMTGEHIPERMFSEYSRIDLNSMLASRTMAVIKKAVDLMDSDKTWTGHELTLKEFLIAY